MEKSKWDRLKVQFAKCFTIETLHVYLTEEGFQAEADILEKKGVDGLRFVELSEKDFSSWRLTTNQISKILDCRQSLLSPVVTEASPPLGVKKLPLDRHETKETANQVMPPSLKRTTQLCPSGYMPMGMNNKSPLLARRRNYSPPVVKPPGISLQIRPKTNATSLRSNVAANFPKTEPHVSLKLNEPLPPKVIPRSKSFKDDYLSPDPPITDNSRSMLPKTQSKPPIDHRKIVDPLVIQESGAPNASKSVFRKGSCPTPPSLLIKEIKLTKAQSDTSINQMPEEIYEPPPTPKDTEEIYEEPPLIPSDFVKNAVHPSTYDKSRVRYPSPSRILSQDVEKPKASKNSNRKLPRPPPLENSFEESHVNVCKELLQNFDDETDDNNLNLNDCVYYRNTDRKGAEELLNSLPNLIDGTFLLRKSYSGKSFLVLTVFYKRFYNIGIHRSDDDSFFCKGGSKRTHEVMFDTLEDFVKYYRQYPLKVKTKKDDLVIHIFLTESLPAHIF